jgi:3',5'-cyclic AMP phosphodiesterase CpdA
MMNAEKPSFVIQCGDLVDGWADDPVRTAADIDSVLEVVGRFTSPAYHVAGNHCYRAGAATLRRKYHLRSLYYDFRLPDVAGWRFIALDGNDAGYGLLGRAQLRWLGARLADALRRKERVIVFCHFPAVTEALPDERRGNADTLLSILEKSGVVRMYISGHEHAGGYALSRGIHHLTLKAMVDQSVRPTFAVMDVYDDQIIERGFGSEPDRILPIDPLPPAPKKARSRH